VFEAAKLGLTRSAPDRLKIYKKSASSPYAASATSYYKRSNYRALVVFLTRPGRPVLPCRARCNRFKP